jgi:hypothetical protein
MEAIIKLSRVLFLCCLISCTTKKNIETTAHEEIRLGKFTTNNLYKSPNYEEVVLQKNHDVSYSLRLETFGNHELKGKWKFKSDTLKLFFKIPKQKSNGKIQITYGKEKKKFFDIIVNDELGLLFGCKLFVNDTEYLVDSKDLKIESQFIKNFKVIYNGETYEKKINKFVNTDVTLLMELVKYRNSVYDFITTEWIVKDDKLFKQSNGQLNEKTFLVYEH